MRISALVREAGRSAISRPVPSLLIAALCAVICAMSIVTVGRTAGVEAAVLERLEAAGSRQFVVSDRTEGGLLSPSVVEVSAGLSSVDRAVGLSSATDARSAAVGEGGTAVPAWGVVGDLHGVAVLVSGRWPEAGEAIVSEASAVVLGLDGAAGALEVGDDECPVVGVFTVREPFEMLADGALIRRENQVSRELYVIATSSAETRNAQQTVLAIVAADSVEDLSVRSAVSLAEVQENIAGDMTSFSRGLLFIVMGAGGMVVCAVVLADSLVRRDDIGRRRALGSTRATIVAMVVLRAVFGGLVGVVVGCAAAVGATMWWDYSVPSGFVGGVAILTLLVTSVASTVPAVWAAHQDPVRVLRVS